MNKCLLIIDVQNDYFEHGKNPLYNSEETVHNTILASLNGVFGRITNLENIEKEI